VQRDFTGSSKVELDCAALRRIVPEKPRLVDNHPKPSLPVFHGCPDRFQSVPGERLGWDAKRITGAVVDPQARRSRDQQVVVIVIAKVGDAVTRECAAIARRMFVDFDGVPIVPVETILGPDPKKAKSVTVNTCNPVLRESVERRDVIKPKIGRLAGE